MRTRAILLLALAACDGGSSNAHFGSPGDGGASAGDSGLPAGAVLLATFDGTLSSVIVDGDSLYVGVMGTQKAGILRIASAGGELQELATDAAVGSSIAVDDANVYWGNRGGLEVKRVPKNGGPATVVASFKDTRPSYVAVDDANVYVQGELTDTVYSYKKGGTAGPTFVGAAGVSPCGIATDAAAIYICASTGLYLASKGGGDRTEIYKGSGGPDKAVEGFALDQGSAFVSIHVDPCTEKGVLFVPSPGAPGQELAPSCGTNNMVATGGVLFWSSSYNGLRSVPRAGGESKVYDPQAIGPVAVDAKNVYFTRRDEATSQNKLYRAPR